MSLQDAKSHHHVHLVNTLQEATRLYVDYHHYNRTLQDVTGKLYLTRDNIDKIILL